VLLFNSGMGPDLFDRQTAVEAIKQVRLAVERLGRYPDIDLFDEHR
jgi:hypothetical protein